MIQYIIKYLMNQSGRSEIENIYSHIDDEHPLSQEWIKMKNCDAITKALLSDDEADNELWNKIFEKIKNQE
ncbi:MAG: hypothetical protein ACRDD8_11850 [Bacteroidales bacterium]